MSALTEAGLVQAFTEPPGKVGRPKKSYRLTKLGRKLLTPFLLTSTRVQLIDPDSNEVKRLMRVIMSGSSGEVKRRAIADLKDLARTTRLWKRPPFIKFLKEALRRESLRLDALDLIRLVSISALRDEDRKSAQDLLKRYGKPIAGIVRSSKQELNVRSVTMLSFIGLQKTNITRTKYSELKALTKFLLQECNEEVFNDLRSSMLLWLRGFWKSNPREARRWLDGLMQKKDPTIVKRAVQLRAGLPSDHHNPSAFPEPAESAGACIL
jgi:hypothetical protein